MKKKSSAFSAAATAAKAVPTPAAPSVDHLGDRLGAIAQSQHTIRTNTLEVAPEECVIWERHNRNFELLTEDRCSDLIESFIAQGRQETPAIVRRLNTRQNPKYEIITGARRFWTVRWLREHNYPEFKYLIEVRQLTDEQAFRLSNLENLDRVDISDYERALDYQSALGYYYNGKQADMAARLNKPPMWVSRYLALAELPKQLVDAYASWSDLKLRHAPELAKLLRHKTSKSKVLEAAAELHANHQAAKNTGLASLGGADVFKALKAAATAKPKKKPGVVAEFAAGDKGPVLTLKSKNQASLNFVVKTTTGASQKEVEVAFREALTQYYS